MTTHAICYEMRNSRNASNSGVRNDQAFGYRFSGAVASDSGITGIGYPTIPPSAHSGLAFQKADYLINTDDPAVAIGSGMADLTSGVLDGATLANSGPLLTATQLGTGRLSPYPTLSFGGAYAAAVVAVAGDPTTAEGYLQYSYTNHPYTGLAHFIDFEEQPPETAGDGTAATRALLNKIREGGNTYTLGTDSSGSAITLSNCSYAAMAPEGAVYIEAADVGTDIEDINPAGGLNSKDNFYFHPSVFIPAGQAKYLRGLDRSLADAVAITIAPQVFGITVVDQAVSSSKWLVIVDGQPQILRIIHPAGTDFRRPRDIWQNVWVPTLASADNIADAVSFGEAVGTPSVGYLSTRLAYATYFRCLPLPGTITTQSFG